MPTVEGLTPAPTAEANLPNPASVYCEEKGGKVELREDASGGVAGICVFSDGSECDEWAYFRGECQPGGTPGAPEPTAAVEAELAGDGWKIYRTETLGYRWVIEEVGAACTAPAVNAVLTAATS